MKLNLLILSSLSLFATIVTSSTTETNIDIPLYKQAGAPIPNRVTDLLSRMNLNELIGQVTHRYAGMDVYQVEQMYGKTGLGQVSMQTMLLNGSSLVDTVNKRNAFQQYFMTNSRLQIPVSIAHEGLHSGGEFGTIFPESLLTSCSWNDTLALYIGQVLGLEARSYGVDNTFSPVVNMFTDSRYGRYQEGFSPDPTITSHFGRNFVLGIQGGVSTSNDYLPGGFNTTAWCTAKHYCGYGSAVGGLNGAPFILNNRTLFEQFLRPWRSMSAIGLRGIMPSHNTVLDIPMHAHKYLIQDVLRNEFGFGNGSAVSDCNDIAALNFFGISENLTVATAFAILAGVDLDLQCGTEPTNYAYYAWIPDAINSGLVQLSDLQALVSHVLTQKFAAGLFDQPYTPLEWINNIHTPAHQQLAYEAAVQSIVLLQNNNNTLPITMTPKVKLAMIGPHILCSINNTFDSSSWFTTYGNSYGPLTTTKEKSTCYGRQNMLGSYVLDTGTIDVPLLPDIVNSTFGNTVDITVTPGCSIDGNGRFDLINNAVTAANNADYAIVVLGDSLSSCGEWADRDSLDLPGGQLQLLETLVNSTTTPIILVLINGRAVSFGPSNALLPRLAAVIEAWRPGEAGAQAIIDIITGRQNPTGKLTNQWAQHVGQLGSGSQPWLQRVVGKWLANGRSTPDPTDGRMYDNYISSAYPSTPLFRFGHGLSYTTYEYKTIEVTILSTFSTLPYNGRGNGVGYREAVNTNVLNVTVSVCNTGKVDGTEIIQIYSIGPKAASKIGIVSFWKRLIGYTRIYLSASQCNSITTSILADDFAQYDDNMNLRVLPGNYVISAGGRRNQNFLQQNITIL